ncbi:MAG TPA: serine/threonine-protein kinase [Kofleriaceae bacterium]|nr:serine/threonine-protein kinase [Kofleriaceae bacterium]
MDDERRRRVELGGAPTTPGHGNADRTPDSTIDMQASGDAPSEPGPGAAIGRFVVRARLGEGGMGVVYAGEDADLGRKVAIKLVRGDSEHPAYRARLLREAKAMARLEHPNVVRVYEVGSDRGRLFVAMELVDGKTLTSWLREPHGTAEILAMFAQVGAGLAAVHAAGLVHRDFKPDNVLVDRGGRARVADFGLARLGERSDLTTSGVMMGTPGYMAPEQQFGADVDARADQYSFCVALREALGGRPLDEARYRAAPQQLRDAIARGLSYDAGERFASMTELLAAITGTALAAPAREPRWIPALAVLGALGVVAGVVAFVTSRKHDEPAPPAAAPPPQAAALAPAPPRDAAPAAAPADAQLAIADLLPRDAGAASHPVHRPRATPPADAAPSGGPVLDLIHAGGIHVEYVGTPTAAAKVGDPAHLAAERAAIRGLGYGGVAFDRPLDVLARELADTAASSSGNDAAIAQVKLGMVQRRRGDCAAAEATWKPATDVLYKDHDPVAQGWAARGLLGLCLCALADGRHDDAKTYYGRSWISGGFKLMHDEEMFVDGLLYFDEGDLRGAHGLMLSVRASSEPGVVEALHRWLDATGYGL